MNDVTRTSKELSNEQLLEAFEVAVIQHARTFRQTLSIKREEALDAKEAARAAVLSSMRASHEPPAGCAQCSNVAPIAKLTVRDGLAVRAGLYAPGLPDGDHDVYPTASSQPPADEQLPSAWIKGHTMHTDAGLEYDEEVVPGSDRPNGDGWHPLYSRPPQPPESHLAIEELKNLINAKRFDRYYFANDTEFAEWALSRARYTLGLIERTPSTKEVRCNCAGVAPTMPTFRKEHLPTCPCSGLGEGESR